MRALYFQTNFEILHMQFARSRAFQGMFEAFDASEVRCRSAVGCARASSRARCLLQHCNTRTKQIKLTLFTQGFLKHRFGDANVRLFQVLGSLKISEILQVIALCVSLSDLSVRSCRRRCATAMECSATELKIALFMKKTRKVS